MSKTYTPEFKLQVVLRRNFCAKRSSRIEPTPRLFGPTRFTLRALSNWKKKLKDNGAKAFGGAGELKEKEKKIANLECMMGQKVEIALLRSPLLREQAFWARADHDREGSPRGSA